MTSKQLSVNTRLADMDNNIDGYLTRKMKTSHGISRLTLGEIGNRVSAITIDTSKGGAIKKEILQPTGGVLANAQSANIRIPSTACDISTNHFNDIKQLPQRTQILKAETDLAPVKVEWIPDHNLLPNASHGTESDAALFETLAQSVAPMDISDHGMGIFSQSALCEQIEDIDADDRDNPQLVSIYVNPIYSYMRQLEKKYSIRQNLLEGTDVTGKMRAILIDWLCQVHSRFHLLQETLYLTVSIIDRYLQAKPCSRTKLQLVGVTAMLLASKYEEMYAPEVADFVYITDYAYTKKDVRDMEQDILRTLDFSFGRPLCLHFLRRNSKAGQDVLVIEWRLCLKFDAAASNFEFKACRDHVELDYLQVDATKHTLAKYLMELAMVEYDMAHIRPSYIAAGALYLAMRVLDGSQWTPTLQFYSFYSEDELLPLVQKLAHLVVKAESSKLIAVKTKYSASKFMKIAAVPQLKSKTVSEIASSGIVKTS